MGHGGAEEHGLPAAGDSPEDLLDLRRRESPALLQHLAHLDEVTHAWFGTSDAKEAVRRKVADIYERRSRGGGLAFIIMEATYVNQGGEPLLKERATYIGRE